MDKAEIVKVAPDDPNRCQSVTAFGQCPNKSVEGDMKLCPIHICAHHSTLAKRDNRIYNLTKVRARVHELADHGQITSLKEEVGIVRLLLENVLNKCNNENDLLIHTSIISELALKIQKLVKDLHSLDKSTGNLLDKSTILKIAGGMIGIIEKYVTDKVILSKISDDLIKLVEDALPSEEND